VIGGLALVSVFTAWLLTRGSKLDRDHFEAVHEGMTRAEIEEILAGPPRNERRDRVIVWVPRDGKRVSAELQPGPVTERFFPAGEGEEVVWVGRAGLIAARFGDDGRLTEKYVSAVHGPDETPLGAAFRRLFGREAARQPVVPKAQLK
jgi:hypothetical protein